MKTCKNIDRAWEILDIEFADKRKLMDELLAEIDNYSTVKGDSKSLGRFATSISVFVSDMENNGCPVQEVSEAPFFMSKLEKRTTRKRDAAIKERTKCGKFSRLAPPRRSLSIQGKERKKLREAAATEPSEVEEPIITPMTLTLQKMMNLVPSAAGLSICSLPVRYTKD